MTIQDLFDKAGGAWKLAGELNIHQWSVERWKKNGVPYKHWDYLNKRYKVARSDLDEMSRKVRK